MIDSTLHLIKSSCRTSEWTPNMEYHYAVFTIRDRNISHVYHIDLRARDLAHVPCTCMSEILQIATGWVLGGIPKFVQYWPTNACRCGCLPHMLCQRSRDNDLHLYLRHANVHLCVTFQIITETDRSIVGCQLDLRRGRDASRRCRRRTRSLHSQWCTSLDLATSRKWRTHEGTCQ
jgi:hypothetical protein